MGQIMKGIDAVILALAFCMAYFFDEFIRLLTSLSVKAYAIGPTFSGLVYFIFNYWMMLVGFPLIWVAVLALNGIYRRYRTLSFRKLCYLILVSSIWASVASGSFVFLLNIDLASRLFFTVYTVTAYALLIVEKWLLFRLLNLAHSRGYNQENLLIVGTGKRAREFIHAVKQHSNWGLRIIGLIDDEHNLYGKQVDGCRVIGRIQDIPFLINHLVIDRVIFVVPRLWLHRIEEAIQACEEVGISTSISLDLYNLRIARTHQTDFNGFPLLEFETFRAKEWQLFIKRLIDILVSLLFLVFFSPLMLMVAIITKLTSPGPVLFKQVRAGLKGRKFTLLKFRSMVVDAEAKKFQLLDSNEMDGPVFKIKRDPRITRIGAILRKTSIDELPQFINVLMGDMSIVGPRPPLPQEVEHYQIWQRRRLSLKPGITCIWQVSGRNKIGFDQWMRMDMQYIDNWSLTLDLKILFKTFFVVLVGYGAE
ncbi:sugar transferase [candidate division KSB1 bacterium]|nr:sugar transferase [candidate division KSB1 bacterium]